MPTLKSTTNNFDELTEPIKATGLPIVDLTGEHEDDKDIISVDCDAHKIGVMAAERFLRRGFTSFAIYSVSDTRAWRTRCLQSGLQTNRR